ncbi:MAG TPA: GvpL/GvpF family gas vesicle protein [Bacillales bacterium]
MAELVYLYGLIPDKELEKEALPAYKGLDGKHEVYPMSIKDMAALVCYLDENEYSEAAIKEKTNDMEWLKENAFHHHEMLIALNERYNVIPMKFCTIFANDESLRETIEKNEAKLTNSFSLIEGNEEWNLKIYCDDTELKKHVSAHNSNIEAKKEEISQLSPGRQYFAKKKIGQMVEQELENEKNAVCEGIHEQLSQFSLHDTVKKNWNKDVTGRKDQMSWNSVYLVPNARVEDFLKKINQLKEEWAGFGWKFEASGPWPAYHFASLT